VATNVFESGGYTYTTVHDVTSAYPVLVTGALVDGIALRPPRSQPAVIVDPPRGDVRVLQRELYCLAGEPLAVFPALGHPNVQVRVTATAPGYRPAERVVPVPAGVTFPISGQDLTLAPLPVRLAGRVVVSGIDSTAVADAVVATGGDVLALRTPLHRPFPGNAPVRGLTASLGANHTTLAAPAAAGTRVVRLQNAGSLGGGSVICVGWSNPTGSSRLAEFVDVHAPGPGQDELTLAQPLNATYQAGTDVADATFTATGGTWTLNDPVEAGDAVVRLNATVPTPPQLLELTDPVTGDVERQAIGALSDSGGWFAFDGFGGVAAVELSATASGAAAAGPPVAWAVEFDRPVNVVNLTVS
jgi:hypothetical protein